MPPPYLVDVGALNCRALTVGLCAGKFRFKVLPVDVLQFLIVGNAKHGRADVASIAGLVAVEEAAAGADGIPAAVLASVIVVTVEEVVPADGAHFAFLIGFCLGNHFPWQVLFAIIEGWCQL